MNSLSSRQDLLSSHEHVVRVGVFLVWKTRQVTMNNTKHKTLNLEPKLWTGPHKLAKEAIKGGYMVCQVIYVTAMKATFISTLQLLAKLRNGTFLFAPTLRVIETYGVVWIRHCVERSNSQGIFIQNVEVGIILQNQQKCQRLLHYKSCTFDNENLFTGVVSLLCSPQAQEAFVWIKTTKRGKMSDRDLDGVMQCVMYCLWGL